MINEVLTHDVGPSSKETLPVVLPPVPLFHLPPPEYQISHEFVEVQIGEANEASRIGPFYHPFAIPTSAQGDLPPEAVAIRDSYMQGAETSVPSEHPEVQRLEVFIDTCLRAGILATAGEDEHKVADLTTRLYLTRRHPGVVDLDKEDPNTQALIKSASLIIDLITQEIVGGTGLTTIELQLAQDPWAGCIAMMYLMAEECTMMHGSANSDERMSHNILITKAIRDFARAEGPPSEYMSGNHPTRGVYSSLLVLMRDSHIRYAEPTLARHMANQIGQFTHIRDYGHLFYLSKHYLPYEEPTARAMMGAISYPEAALPTTYDEAQDVGVYESNAKGWWGIVESFLSQAESQRAIEELAKKYGIPYSSTEYPPRYPYRFSNALVYADQLDTLIEQHSSESDVQQLLQRLSRYIQSVPDYARMRVVVGNSKWENAYAVLRQKGEARFLFAVTYPDGHTEHWMIPLDHAENLTDETFGQASSGGLAQILREANAEVKGGGIVSLMTSVHANCTARGLYPFTAICDRGASDLSLQGAHIPFEILLVPSAVAAQGWKSTGMYKDLDSSSKKSS